MPGDTAEPLGPGRGPCRRRGEVAPGFQLVGERGLAARPTHAWQLFTEGNADLGESRFAQALTKYREAIGHWDHPAIRFNMAICPIHLEQFVEAKDHLERGIAYGAAALGEDAYLAGDSYRELFDLQITRLTIVCREPGAQISLDGEYLFTGPGEEMRYVLRGEHLVLATPIRRWPRWEPYAVLAVGGIATGAGAFAYRASERSQAWA